MRIKKKVLADIEKCYAVSALQIDGAPCLIYAGEGQGSLHAFRGKDWADHEVIWQGGGGTMSVVPLAENFFLASRGFYSMVEAAGSTIELVRFRDGVFTHESVASLPYLHRFGLLTAPDGRRHILAANIADYKENKEDWSHPGHLYSAVLPTSCQKAFILEFQRLNGDYHINHGFCTARHAGQEKGYIACREGLFSLSPPESRDGTWHIDQLMDWPVSDIAVCDIDGDGQAEIAAIQPFHGNEFKVYRQSDGKLREFYSYLTPNDFYHTVISAQLGESPVFVGGARQVSANLFVLYWDKEEGRLKDFEVDAGEGPSNAFMYQAHGQPLLLAANRMRGQAVLYELG